MDHILDDLGDGVTNIVSPVSICMVLTIAMVRLLNPEGSESRDAVVIANLYYKENVRNGKITSLA